jgi:DNA polymerase III psi subunit
MRSPVLSHGSYGSVPQSSDGANAWQGNNVSAEERLEAGGNESGSSEGALLKDVLRSMLEQQSQIRELQKENMELKKAVCKLDKKAPFCRLES